MHQIYRCDENKPVLRREAPRLPEQSRQQHPKYMSFFRARPFSPPTQGRSSGHRFLGGGRW